MMAEPDFDPRVHLSAKDKMEQRDRSMDAAEVDLLAARTV